jgi:hypothetical protein
VSSTEEREEDTFREDGKVGDREFEEDGKDEEVQDVAGDPTLHEVVGTFLAFLVEHEEPLEEKYVGQALGDGEVEVGFQQAHEVEEGEEDEELHFAID